MEQVVAEKYAVVITTINYPTEAVRVIAENAPRLGAEFILIGDSKSPADFHQPGATFLSLDAQRSTGFQYATKAPTRHYARKNIGYLAAIAGGATVIIETDDDNIPRDGFWEPRVADVTADRVDFDRWVNAYAFFSTTPVWPRGLPLPEVLKSTPGRVELTAGAWHCPIQQGLADENPDVDAIYRLVHPLPLNFDPNPPVALINAWSPFNSQNTTWFSDAFPLLYLPYFCSFRMTDIWRSFVAQRIAYANGWHVLYHASTVYQDRNEHNLMRDFEEEIPGYLHNDRIREALNALSIPTGVAALPDALRLCYKVLVDMELVGAGELELLEAWLHDLEGLRKF